MNFPRKNAIPDLKSIFDVNKFASNAEEVLTEDVWKYVQWKSERGLTYQRSEQIFNSVLLKPRIMVNVSERDMSTTLLGYRVNSPIGISPTAAHKLYHPDGEVGVAKATNRTRSLYIMSCFSDTLIPEVTAALRDEESSSEVDNLKVNKQNDPNMKKKSNGILGIKVHKDEGLGWMQTYIFKDREGTLRIVREAEDCGMKALVVTVDDCKEPWGKEPHNDTFVKNISYQVLKRAGIMKENPEIKDIDNIHDQSLTWSDFSWLVRNTSLPVVAKGVLTPGDAMMAVQHGARGILVSAHGGRLLDGLPAPLEVLPEIVTAVGDKAEVYIDGGVRYGSDVFKALALGARAVFIGRPIIWGLAVGGSRGVERVLDILHNQLDSNMALAGCKNVVEITRDRIHTSHF